MEEEEQVEEYKRGSCSQGPDVLHIFTSSSFTISRYRIKTTLCLFSVISPPFAVSCQKLLRGERGKKKPNVLHRGRSQHLSKGRGCSPGKCVGALCDVTEFHGLSGAISGGK